MCPITAYRPKSILISLFLYVCAQFDGMRLLHVMCVCVCACARDCTWADVQLQGLKQEAFQMDLKFMNKPASFMVRQHQLGRVKAAVSRYLTTWGFSRKRWTYTRLNPKHARISRTSSQCPRMAYCGRTTRYRSLHRSTSASRMDSPASA